MSVLSTKGIVKDYPGTRALDDVTVSFESGKVHAFIGKTGQESLRWLKYLPVQSSRQRDSSFWIMRNCILKIRWMQ